MSSNTAHPFSDVTGQAGLSATSINPPGHTEATDEQQQSNDTSLQAPDLNHNNNQIPSAGYGGHHGPSFSAITRISPLRRYKDMLRGQYHLAKLEPYKGSNISIIDESGNSKKLDDYGIEFHGGFFGGVDRDRTR